jgi:hypothetical protein
MSLAIDFNKTCNLNENINILFSEGSCFIAVVAGKMLVNRKSTPFS